MNFKSIFYLFIAASVAISLQAAASGDTIHLAASRGDVPAVQRFIAEKPSLVNQPTNDGKTPLHFAVVHGQEAVVKTLLYGGADVNQLTNSGETPLHIAAYYGQEAVVKTLLDHGANVNQLTSLGETPLQYAICLDRAAVVETLLDHGAHVNQPDNKGETPLQYAIRLGDREAVVETLKAGLKLRAAQLAIMSAALPHPGANSPLQGLSKDILEQIARYHLRTEDFSALSHR